jgi:hypothetical protein
MTGSASDFDVAKNVTELLEKLDKGRQELVLRWVRESLNLDPVAAPPPQLPPLSQAGGVAPLGLAAAPGTDAGSPRGAVVDIKAFVDDKQPKSDMQFSAVVAYYYRFVAPVEQRREVIDGQVLQDAARLAGRPRPPKPHMTLTNAKNQGYLDKSGRGEFRLNTVGENLVAMTLPGDGAAPRSVSSRRGSGKASRAKSSKKRKGTK